MNKCYRLGIDIGSTTVKIAVLDDENHFLFSDYERHFANIQETLADLLTKAVDKLGPIDIYPVITGSGGLTLAQYLDCLLYTSNYHETWIQYRTTCELLKYHRYLYLTKSHPYNDSEETIDNIFVRNIENIISSENDQWKAYASDESFKTDNSN